MSKSLEEAFE